MAWFVYASNKTSAKFVAKMDDDTLANLPRLVSELQGVSATAPHASRAYYGVHVYRLWDWTRQPRVGDAACGDHQDAGPPQRCARLLASLEAAVRPGGKCHGSIGPADRQSAQ